jgi:ABC-2 type transport system ATP-binding protein
LRQRIGLAGQYAAVDENLTGLENLTMVGRLYGSRRAAAKTRGRELMEQFDLVDAANRPVKNYSGGMRRRLDLAAALVAKPPVLFLDEPTTGLDPRSRETVWASIGELREAGVTVLLTTQYLEEADRLADRIAILDGGRIVADGTAGELKRRIASKRLEVVLRDGRTLDVPTDGSAAHVRALLDELDPGRDAVARFAVREPTLDDVFLELTHV